MRPKQIELARHALGLDGRRTASYRNYFVCGPSPDYSEWCDMVDEGDAARTDGSKLQFGGDDLFRLTLQGARKALLPAETLDREDFPAASWPSASKRKRKSRSPIHHEPPSCPRK